VTTQTRAPAAKKMTSKIVPMDSFLGFTCSSTDYYVRTTVWTLGDSSCHSRHASSAGVLAHS
jgi:hypothetical protein